MLHQSLEKRRSIGQVAEEVHVHTATVWRWTTKGVKGRKLRTILVGGRRFVLESDLSKFLNQEEPGGSSPDRDQRADIAGRLLNAQGVRPKSATNRSRKKAS